MAFGISGVKETKEYMSKKSAQGKQSQCDKRNKKDELSHLARVVVRNTERVILLTYSEVHHDVPSTFAAEVIVCRKAVQIGVEQEWPKIIIEVATESLKRKEELYVEIKAQNMLRNKTRSNGERNQIEEEMKKKYIRGKQGK
ncbi:hypothetical protein GOBAR_AA29716 [Gossypium barbadense]|uniref:Uncharacterized protein n=1 Tax=Gossypium barbadense TaxID=3634 RepID=A0A2P5WIR0_GOSBA|nr:hypothetical protein GOBAR_AA29716 [Gossypium barbadense]